MCVWVIVRLPQRLKSTFFEIFRHFGEPHPPLEKMLKKTLDLAFEANSTLSFQNGLFSWFYLIMLCK